MGALDFLSDALHYAVELMYDQFYEGVEEYWAQVEPALNHGQQVIYGNHMSPAINDYLGQAGDDWPWTEAGYMADDLYSCYDYSVMERAFSDVIEAPLDKMDDQIYRAQIVEELAYAAEAAGI